MARSVKGASGVGFDGLAADSGRMGFDPWPAGQYAIQVKDASDEKPSKKGHYWLKLTSTIIGVPQNVDFGERDPLGKPLFENLYIPRDSSAKWYKQALAKLKNRLNAAHVEVDEETNWIADPKGVKAFVNAKYAITIGVKDNEETGDPEQTYGKSVPLSESDYAQAAKSRK